MTDKRQSTGYEKHRAKVRGQIIKSSMPWVLCCILFVLSLLLPSPLLAKITGNCSNCHTMHNSQNGSSMNFDGSTTPNEVLLRATCLGCHSEANGTSWKNGVSGAPVVLNTVEPTYNTAKGLAGGNFYYVSTTVDNTGHNVLPGNPDGTLVNTPPGGSFPSGGTYSGQLRCAGTRGCHGHNAGQSGDTAVDNQIMGIKGAHHGNDTPPLGGSLTNVADNYRFLLGIKGREDADWEEDVVNTSHNEYQGATNFTTTTTISYLCGECHGNSGGGGFHNSTGVGSASPWLRHPTDIALISTGEYANYTTYSMVAPIARPDPDNVTNTTIVTPGTDIIMCLSCHRAHASPYFKMMRWDYKRWPECLTVAPLCTINGCNVCHTSKN